MNESVRNLKSSEVCAVEYCTATSSLTVVEMGASLEGSRRWQMAEQTWWVLGSLDSSL